MARIVRGTRKVGDPQKDLVYSAESVIPLGPLMPTINEVQRYVNQIVSSEWFRERAPGLEYIKVEPVGGKKFAASKNLSTRIVMNRRSRRDAYVLHEIAHQLTDHIHGAEGIEGHGAHFAHWELQLIERFLGPEKAALLEASFERAGVRYRLTEEERAVCARGTKRAVPKPLVDDEVPGEVRRRYNAITGNLMLMIDTRRGDGRYAAEPGRPWVVVCAESGNTSSHPTRTEAKTWMGYPTWCSHCKSSVWYAERRAWRTRSALRRKLGWDDERI